LELQRSPSSWLALLSFEAIFCIKQKTSASIFLHKSSRWTWVYQISILLFLSMSFVVKLTHRTLTWQCFNLEPQTTPSALLSPRKPFRQSSWDPAPVSPEFTVCSVNISEWN
jgi:hypothetical protein